MPYLTPCNHRRCGGEPCRMLTPDEVEPDDDDLALARQLVAEGWGSTSAKYRSIARLVGVLPYTKTDKRCGHPPDHVYILHRWTYMNGGVWDDVVERRTLTVKQFRAFKQLGGRIAHHLPIPPQFLPRSETP